MVTSALETPTEGRKNAMTNVELQARFDMIVDDYDPEDSISVEDANYEVDRYCQEFLEAGFDANQITKLLAREDVLKHYYELVAHGARIDITQLSWEFDEDYVKKHWDKFVKCGAEPDCLADRCYSRDNDVSNIYDLEELYARGVSARKMFELIKRWLWAIESEDEDEILIWLCDHGLPEAEAAKWVEERTDIDHIVWYGEDLLERLGMSNASFIDRWLKDYGLESLNGHLDELPPMISVEKIFSYFSMQDIIANFYIDDLVDEYLEYGSIDDLAQKFINDIGYSSNPEHSEYLFTFTLYGASVIDHERFVNSVDVDQLSDDDAEFWYECLQEAGYDEKLLSKFLR